MSKPYLELSKQQQKEILQTVATKLKKPALVLEKDFWVCWILEVLFSMPNAHPMAFKGGTSLSKVYDIIHRFSEDIDITLDYRKIKDGFDPFKENISNNQIKKLNRQLNNYVEDYAKNTLVPFIHSRLKGLPTAAHHEATMEGSKIWISYPSVIESTDKYLREKVLIELGGRNVIDPNEVAVVQPDIASHTSNLIFSSGKVTVLSPERTFWQKVTLIHVKCQRGQLRENAERLSRHWYDLMMLSQHESGQRAISDRKLFKDVVHHKKVFFNASYANYDDCLRGALTLIPRQECLDSLRIDYKNMVDAGMVYDDLPSFDNMMKIISNMENRINAAHTVIEKTT